jgi:hypothetical protein
MCPLVVDEEEVAADMGVDDHPFYPLLRLLLLPLLLLVGHPQVLGQYLELLPIPVSSLVFFLDAMGHEVPQHHHHHHHRAEHKDQLGHQD